MFKRPREFCAEKPTLKKPKYDLEEMMCDDAQPTQTALLHAFHAPTQNHQDLFQKCSEQYEEIQYIKQNWIPNNWARVQNDYLKQKIETFTNIASSFTEFQEREFFLNFLNEKMIHSFIYHKSTLLALENKKLTRFPVSVLNDPQLTEYWSQLKSLFLGGNQLRKIPDEFIKLQSLQRLELNRNQLKTIPAALLSLQNLEYLALSHNHLNCLSLKPGTSPMLVLRYLYLSDNHLSEEQLLPFRDKFGIEWFQRTSSNQTPPTQTQRFRI